jgi:hypothetical protein
MHSQKQTTTNETFIMQLKGILLTSGQANAYQEHQQHLQHGSASAALLPVAST